MHSIDLTGQTFGRLVVIEKAGTDKHRYTTWRCRCECGNEHIARGRHLRIGDTKSCGCLNAESVRRSDNKHRTHGHHAGGKTSPTHNSWTCMKARCYRPGDVDYHNYGGRGITVCDRWRESFPAFLADMGERPDGRTLDRIDVNGNYGPSNCRWATYEEQARNRRPKAGLPQYDYALLPDWVTAQWLRAAAAYLERAEAGDFTTERQAA